MSLLSYIITQSVTRKNSLMVILYSLLPNLHESYMYYMSNKREFEEHYKYDVKIG